MAWRIPLPQYHITLPRKALERDLLLGQCFTGVSLATAAASAGPAIDRDFTVAATVIGVYLAT